MKLLVTNGSDWSLVYTLNNRGDSTEPCGRPFIWFRHLTCLPFSSTLNRRFDSIVIIILTLSTSQNRNHDPYPAKSSLVTLRVSSCVLATSFLHALLGFISEF